MFKREIMLRLYYTTHSNKKILESDLSHGDCYSTVLNKRSLSWFARSNSEILIVKIERLTKYVKTSPLKPIVVKRFFLKPNVINRSPYGAIYAYLTEPSTLPLSKNVDIDSLTRYAEELGIERIDDAIYK